MTTDEAKELLENGAAHEEEVDFCERLYEARKVAVKALDEVDKYRKAVEGIKADIESKLSTLTDSQEDTAVTSGLEDALDIIEKHLEGISSVATSKESDYTGKCGSCKYFAFCVEFDEKGEHRLCCNLKNGNLYQLASSGPCGLYAKGDDTSEANISST